MENNLCLFNKLIESRKKLDEIVNYIKKSEKGLPAKNNFVAILASLKNIYRNKNEEITAIDFPLMTRITSFNKNNNYKLYFQEKEIQYQVERINYNSIEYRYSFKYQLYGDSFICLKHERMPPLPYTKKADEKRNIVQSDETIMVKDIENIIVKLDKTKQFYHDLIDLFKNKTVIEFVQAYQEYRELITVVFLLLPDELKEPMFYEVKKEGQTINIQDIEKIVKIVGAKLLSNGSMIGKKYTDLSIEEQHFQIVKLGIPIPEDQFYSILKLFDYNSLNDKLKIDEKKENNVIINKSKI